MVAVIKMPLVLWTLISRASGPVSVMEVLQEMDSFAMVSTRYAILLPKAVRLFQQVKNSETPQ